MRAVDRFEVEVDGGGGFQSVTLRINGVELIELVRQVERPLAEAEYDRRVAAGTPAEELSPGGSLAGDYHYLLPEETFLPARGLLGEPFDHVFVAPPTSKFILLQCTCGITQCWFLLAQITVDDDRVTWSDFEQFHRSDWRYDLGPFVFERAAYEAQLAAHEFPAASRGRT